MDSFGEFLGGWTAFTVRSNMKTDTKEVVDKFQAEVPVRKHVPQIENII